MTQRLAESVSTLPLGTRCLHEKDAVELIASICLIYQIRTDELFIKKTANEQFRPKEMERTLVYDAYS